MSSEPLSLPFAFLPQDRYEIMATRLQAWTKGLAERRSHKKKVAAKEKEALGIEGGDDEDEDEKKKDASGAVPAGGGGASRPQRKAPGEKKETKPARRPQAKAMTTFNKGDQASSVKIIDD